MDGPSKVADTDVLSREIFSSNQFKRNSNRVLRNTFQPPRDSQEISTIRSSLISERMLRSVVQRHEKRRGKSCYGVAKVSGAVIRQASWEPKGTPVFWNPYHADIILPPDDGKDSIIDASRQIAEKAKLVLFLN